MLGIILCGGKSQRMGTDKGLIKANAELWAQIAFQKLIDLNFPVKLSVNPEQKKNYVRFFNEELLLVDCPSLKINGPLLGVLSAHLSDQEEDLYILACDLLLMKADLLDKLLLQKQNDNSFEAYVFSNGNELEPLCGIYTAKGLRKTVALFNEEGLQKQSMKFVLSKLNVCKISLLEEEKKCFGNFNEQSDLEGLK